MAEVENKNSNKWQLPFLVVFSLFLVVTFVFYLPLRFRSGLTSDQHVMMDGKMMGDGHGGHLALYHEEVEVREGLVVHSTALDVPYVTQATNRLFFNFWIDEMPNNTPVALDQLEVSNTKLMHVIGVRSDLEGFFHIHPEADTNNGVESNHLAATYQPDQPGRYKIWSEIKKDGVNHVFGHREIRVGGDDSPVENKKVSFTRNFVVGAYQLSLFVKEPISKGREQHLSFDLHTLTGQEAGLEDYLGVPMHLTIIKDDWSQFIHTHPSMARPGSHSFWPIKTVRAHGGVEDENVKSDETVDFDVVFPAAGLYKIFAQFRPEGANLPADETFLATFWVEVQEKAPPVVSSQVWLVLISTMLIVILSLTVNRYLKVKPVSAV